MNCKYCGEPSQQDFCSLEHKAAYKDIMEKIKEMREMDSWLKSKRKPTPKEIRAWEQIKRVLT